MQLETIETRSDQFHNLWINTIFLANTGRTSGNVILGFPLDLAVFAAARLCNEHSTVADFS
jgi:hypothetical protein